MSDGADERFMRRALELAARGLGHTNPNPAVGCVVVKAGRVVGEGWHRRAGGPHAEVAALHAAGSRARGATLYVNLEPCAHQGRTPACGPRLAAAGVARVVAAVADPDLRVSRRGLALLRRSGVRVDVGVLAAEARRLNERFLTSARRSWPFVLLKAAVSLDGRIATARGESKWITGPAQRRAGRRLRRLHDGVAVGIGTVLADDPLLLPEPRVRRPFHRIVFDSRLRLPAASRLVRSARAAPVWVLTRVASGSRRQRGLEARGVRVLSVPGRRRVEVGAALRLLRREGISSLMVEGGSELLGEFVRTGRFDQLALFRGPALLGAASLPAFAWPGPATLDGAPRFRPSPGAADGPYELWYPRR